MLTVTVAFVTVMARHTAEWPRWHAACDASCRCAAEQSPATPAAT
jgi:hypothetical protein